MLTVSGINFKSNYNTNTTGKNSYPILNRQYEKTSTDIITIQKSKQIAFNGLEELSPKLADFFQRFRPILRELDGAQIAEDRFFSGHFIIAHDRDKLWSVIREYGEEMGIEKNKIIIRSKPDDMDGLISDLSMFQEKFSYTFGIPRPFARIHPNDGMLKASFPEKAVDALNMACNPEFYEFLKSGQLAKTKFAVDHNGKFFTLSMNPDIIEWEGQRYNYIDLIAEPFKEE